MPVSSAGNSATFKVTTPSDREIQMTRLFDAPRHLVFDAMSKPEHIKRWWGILGEGYSVPVCEVDLRPGGSWRFVNRTPKGELVTFYGVFQEIVPPERLVYTEIFAPFPDSGSLVTTVLTDENGKTRDSHCALSVAGSSRHGDQDRHGTRRRDQLRPARRRGTRAHELTTTHSTVGASSRAPR